MRITAFLALAALSSSTLALPVEASTDAIATADDVFAVDNVNHDGPPSKPAKGTPPGTPLTKDPKSPPKPFEFPKSCEIPIDFDWTKPLKLKKKCRLPTNFQFPKIDPKQKGFEFPLHCDLPKAADWTKGITLFHECELPKGFTIPKATTSVIPGFKQTEKGGKKEPKQGSAKPKDTKKPKINTAEDAEDATE